MYGGKGGFSRNGRKLFVASVKRLMLFVDVLVRLVDPTFFGSGSNLTVHFESGSYFSNGSGSFLDIFLRIVLGPGNS